MVRCWFRFSGDLKCNADAPSITAAKLGTLKLRGLTGPAQHVPAQSAIDEVLARANLSNTTFAYGYIYPQGPSIYDICTKLLNCHNR